MPDITAWGGVGEIGGNRFLICEGSTQVLLDFGISFERETALFEQPFLQPACLDDLLKTRCLPAIPGCYRNAGFRVRYGTDGPAGLAGVPEARAIDGVLVTHGHTDHCGRLGLLRRDIPVFCSETTARLMELRSTMSVASFDSLDPSALRPVKPGERIDLGTFQAICFPVDHSIPGAVGWVLESGEGRIAYTGDLRSHGLPEGRRETEDFLAEVAREPVDYLLVEGTRLGTERARDERQVQSHALPDEESVRERVSEILRSEPELVMYDGPTMDLKRLSMVTEAACEAGRRVAVDSRLAYYLLKLGADGAGLADVSVADDIHIVLPRRKLPSNSQTCPEVGESGVFAEVFDEGRTGAERVLLAGQRIRRAGANGTLSKIEASAFQEAHIPDGRFIWGTRREAVLREPGQWLVYTTNGPLTCLHFMKEPGSLRGTYIYGKAEPFDLEMEFSFQRLQQWLQLAGLRMDYAHTSGHISRKDLAAFVRDSGARCVVPIHTTAPEKFETMHPNVMHLQVGEPVSLSFGH